MKTNYLLLLLFCSSMALCQTSFEPAFYIDNQENKITGFINNEYWYNAPTAISFKSTPESNITKLDIGTIKSFSVGNVIYERYNVQIDKDPIKMPLENNDANRQPGYISLNVFLKVIISGKASLYSIMYNDNQKFFFKTTTNSVPQQLIYKEYYNSAGKLKNNNEFQKQLFDNVNCHNKTIDYYLKLKYDVDNLTVFFKDYNICEGSDYKVVEGNKKKNVFKVTPFFGISMISHNMSAFLQYSSFEAESVSTPMFGSDFSICLPHKNNKYEFFARISYEKLEGDNYSGKYAVSSIGYITDHAVIDCSIVNIGIGPRYNMFINDSNKIYIEANVGLAIASGDIRYGFQRYSDSGIQETTTEVISLKSSLLLNCGIGYVFNQKFGIGLTADILSKDFVKPNAHVASTKIRSFSAVLRYTFTL